MLDCQRFQFQIPEDIVYLNCAALAPLSKAVEAAGIKGLQKKSKPYTILKSDFFDPVVELKKSFAQLIQLDDYRRVAIIPSVSYGMGNVVQNVKIIPGKNHILLIDEQFPSNYYPWKHWADQHQIELRIIKTPSHNKDRAKHWNEAILKAINPETLLISMPHIHWTDGNLFDLEKIRAKTKNLDALLIVDGSQSVGALPTDITRLQPDALICAGYKWLMGAYGLGLAYYGAYFDDGVPIEHSWFNKKNSADFTALVNYQTAYQEQAHRYNVGEQSNFIAIPMLIEAIKNLLQWKVKNIQDYCRKLVANPIQELLEMGCHIEDAQYRAAHLFGVRLPKQVEITKVLAQFQKQQIYVSQRGEALRISPHLYNNEEDFLKLIQAIKDAW